MNISTKFEIGQKVQFYGMTTKESIVTGSRTFTDEIIGVVKSITIVEQDSGIGIVYDIVDDNGECMQIPEEVLKPYLKPCPFCGEDAKLIEDVDMGYTVGCNTSMCFGNAYEGEQFYEEVDVAVKMWNRRA